jgi:putative pyrroloquinoline-quinone binding quinoprotein
VKQVVSDDRGGALLVVSSSQSACCYPSGEKIVRLDGLTGEVSWEYQHRETYGRFSEIALHPDGTIYVVDKLSDSYAVDLVALDGLDGHERARYDLTGGNHTSTNNTATGPLIQQDGSILTIVSRWSNTSQTAAKTVWRATLSSSLLQSPTFDQVSQVNQVAANNLGIADILSGPWPDGNGGFTVGIAGSSVIAHVGADLVLSPLTTLPFGNLAAKNVQYVLSDDAAYALTQYWLGSGQTAATLFKIDPTSLGILDSTNLNGAGPNTQLTGAISSGGTLYTTPATGSSSQLGYGLLGGWSNSAPAVQTASTATIADTIWPYQRGVTGRRDATNPRLGIFLGGHSVSGIVPGDPTLHASIRIVPKDQRRWAGATGLGFQQDSLGNWFLTIGGHPNPTLNCITSSSSFLFGVLDFWDDVDLSNKRYLAPLPYRLSDEEAIVDGLILSNSNYQGHELLYNCTPAVDDPTYNSNSYAHGLLNKVGLPEPLETSLQPLRLLHYGWYKPVPSANFDPHQ